MSQANKQEIKEFNLSLKKYLKQRSKDYQQYGRYMARDMVMHDLLYRVLSFLGDIVVMLFPIFIWDIMFIITAAGILPYPFFHSFRLVVDTFIILFTLLANTYLMCAFKGQSFGKLAMDLKVVGKENKELSSRVLIIRELFGIELPLVAIFFIFKAIKINVMIGITGFLLLNGLCVVFDKKHRSIIDLLLKSKVVILDDKGKKATFTSKSEKDKEERRMSAENSIDLHVYSSFSHDGEMGVEDLFKKAKQAGIKVLSICDHNSIKANIVAAKLAPLYNIMYIPGINIDCDYKGNHVRILGYFIHGNDDRFMQIEYENLAKEKAVSLRRVQLFEEFTGFKVDCEKLLKSNRFQIISKEMIARQILANTQYRKTKLLQPYLSGNKKDKPISHFIEDFFGKKGAAYVPIAHPKAEDMIALIKASGGVAIVAHPMRSLRNDLDVLEDLLQENIEGIEIFTPYHTHEDMKYLILLAKKYHLQISAGSEYHGGSRPKFILGKTYCPKEVESVVANFVNKYYKG
ncbi:MAG: hypothetical protein EOM50_05585 [Erysipelotrichia bacterium]|nr:hypothetical protein [Erysipelotrichia bacterium]NCC54201.1 hypothetical protein [Erysipelotrichia bacterium]